MVNVSISAERQKDIEIDVRNGTATVFLRADHREVTEEMESANARGKTVKVKTKHWECSEAWMECPAAEAPDPDEMAEDFDAWYGYVEDWKPAAAKTLAQLQADVEFIAAVSGIDLEEV